MMGTPKDAEYKLRQMDIKNANRNLAKPHDERKAVKQSIDPMVNPKGFRQNFHAKQEHKKQAYAKKQYAIDNRYQQLSIPQKKG